MLPIDNGSLQNGMEDAARKLINEATRRKDVIKAKMPELIERAKQAQTLEEKHAIQAEAAMLKEELKNISLEIDRIRQTLSFHPDLPEVTGEN